MAVANVPIFPQTMKAWALDIVNATGTTITQVMAGGANGSVIEAGSLSNTDTGTAQVSLYLNDGSTDHLIATVPAATGAGTSANNNVDLLRASQIVGLPVDSNGNFVIYVPSGWKLRAAVGTTVTAAKTVSLVFQGYDL